MEKQFNFFSVEVYSTSRRGHETKHINMTCKSASSESEVRTHFVKKYEGFCVRVNSIKEVVVVEVPIKVESKASIEKEETETVVSDSVILHESSSHEFFKNNSEINTARRKMFDAKAEYGKLVLGKVHERVNEVYGTIVRNIDNISFEEIRDELRFRIWIQKDSKIVATLVQNKIKK